MGFVISDLPSRIFSTNISGSRMPFDTVHWTVSFSVCGVGWIVRPPAEAGSLWGGSVQSFSSLWGRPEASQLKNYWAATTRCPDRTWVRLSKPDAEQSSPLIAVVSGIADDGLDIHRGFSCRVVVMRVDGDRTKNPPVDLAKDERASGSPHPRGGRPSCEQDSQHRTLSSGVSKSDCAGIEWWGWS